MRVRAVTAVAIASVLLLSGCTSDKLAIDYGNGGGTNYTDDSGLPVLVSPANRKSAVDFTGTTETGTKLKLSDYRGKVVVVNFWYATCSPCRAEAPILESLFTRYENKDVAFVGVNTSDQADSALSFEKDYKISYPSVLDVNSGAAIIAFAGVVAPTATPTTVVLDAKGRVAARMVGQLQSTSILNTLISDTLAESK